MVSGKSSDDERGNKTKGKESDEKSNIEKANDKNTNWKSDEGTSKGKLNGVKTERKLFV